jgi:hypothetical protein
MHASMTEPLVKGLALINTRDWFDERLGAGWFTRTIREFEPDWPERLLPGEWYSIRASLAVYRRGVEQLDGYDSVRQLMEEISGEVALKDLNGILRAFLWAASPKMFLRTAPKIWDTYANFATPEVLRNDVGRFVVKLSEIPEDVVEWSTSAWTGFLVPALGLAGGKDPKVTVRELQQTPGAETWEFVYELTYS